MDMSNRITSFGWVLPCTLLLLFAGPSVSASPSGRSRAEHMLEQVILAAEFEGCAPRDTRDAIELMRRLSVRTNRRFRQHELESAVIEHHDGVLKMSVDIPVGGSCFSRDQTFVAEGPISLPPCTFE
jgi:hypothetical protein